MISSCRVTARPIKASNSGHKAAKLTQMSRLYLLLPDDGHCCRPLGDLIDLCHYLRDPDVTK